MTFHPSVIDCAWASGFWEGEGYIGGVRSSAYPILSVSQKDREPLDRFDRVVRQFGRCSFTNPTTGVTTYSVSGFERVQQIVCMIWPWLSQRRRDQISRVLVAHVARKREILTRRNGPCPRGHTNVVRISNKSKPRGQRRCPDCVRERRETNLELVRAQQRQSTARYRERHPEYYSKGIYVPKAQRRQPEASE